MDKLKKFQNQQDNKKNLRNCSSLYDYSQIKSDKSLAIFKYF